ncbi:MAG: nitronate monooxygenase, partial [Candidatus Contendobacter sp.]|nr:nitronate monooxygenase [Candidatus Contendobacter sp.]
GAAGVQMGTAFLACPESGAHPAYKALLREGSEIATTLSRVFTGRFGRVLRNRLSDGLRSHEAELPGFPSQLFLTQDLRQAAAERNRTDFMALWAGQGCHLCEDRPAAELIATWVGQATALLGEGDAVAMIESSSAANDSDSTDPDSTDPDSTDPDSTDPDLTDPVQ